MTEVATINVTMTFAPTPEGLDAARDLLDAHDAGLTGGSVAIEPSRPRGPSIEGEAAATLFDDGDIASAVYEAASDDGLTRVFLKLLPGEDEEPLTLAEIGEKLKAYWEDDRPLTAAETRAVYRNEKRIERTYKRRGQMPEDRVVVHMEWSHSAGVGRYFVSNADREALRKL